MSQLPKNASDAERFEAAFAGLRERGVSFSPKDLGILQGWLARGIPYEVVARGIQGRLEQLSWDRRPGEAPISSLASCMFQVEAEWVRFRTRAAGGRTEAQPGEQAVWLRELGVALQRPELRVRAEWIRARWADGAPCDEAEVERRTRLLPLILGRALPYLTRRTLLQEARAKYVNAPSSWGWRAKPSRSFFRSVTMRRALALGIEED